MTKELWIRVENKQTYLENEQKIMDIAKDNPGEAELVIYDQSKKEVKRIKKYVDHSGAVVAMLEEIAGANNVKVVDLKHAVDLNKEVQQESGRDFISYVTDKMLYLDILRGLGYTTDQAIKIMIWLKLEDINDELSGCGEFRSVSESLSELADCVGYTAPRYQGGTGYSFLRIAGQVDTD